MAKKRVSFSTRFPNFPLIFVIALVIAIPLTVWSLNHTSTNTTQYARGGGNNGGGNTNSIALTMVTDNNADGLPNWGDVISFNISTSVSTPWVNLKCYQNGNLVAQGWDGYFSGSLTTKNFGLYSPQWPSGAANCTATLYASTSSKKNPALANTSFYVNP